MNWSQTKSIKPINTVFEEMATINWTESKARGNGEKVSVHSTCCSFDLYWNVYGMKYCIRNMYTQIHDNYTLIFFTILNV